MLAAADLVLLDPLVPLADGAEAPFDVEEVLDVLPVEDEVLDELDSDDSDGRGLESVTYQPEPLKMMPAG